MKIYWPAKRFPELAELSDRQRKKVLRECGSLWEWDGTLIGLSALLFFLLELLGNWFGHLMNLGRPTTALCAVLGWFIAAGISVSIGFERLRGRVRQYLEQHADELKTV